MEDFERTTWFTGQATAERVGSSQVTIFDGSTAPRTIKLDEFGKDCVYFGRDKGNDIVLTSHLVSGEHGRFVYRNNVWVIEDKAAYKERGSTNGLVYNECSVVSRVICDGDLIRIDDVENALAEGVLFVFSSGGSGNQWNMLPLAGRRSVSIGRDESCDITLPHVSVSKFHAQIICDNGSFYIVDNNSTNGVIVNGVPVSRRLLHEKDVITITNSKLIFSCASVFYCCYKSGISVDARDIVIKRGRGRKSAITCNHVDLSINPGELVAVIGGSGAGKSTILNCMCGYIKPDNGDVFINGVNLYQNFDALKKVVGYVPQSDIVYDNLTLYDMLMYTSKLRLPKDTTPQEREAAISRAIELVELTEKRKSLIRSLSGGQRKRASIAVELLSDPNLMFLDEPASGLDPGTERNLMQSLRKMADGGKTVILVTHSTLQLKMCDKIVFMGKGGNLCFCGSLDEALKFFGVSDVVDVYNMITEQAPQWSAKYRQYSSSHRRANRTPEVPAKSQKNRLSQLGVLSALSEAGHQRQAEAVPAAGAGAASGGADHAGGGRRAVRAIRHDQEPAVCAVLLGFLGGNAELDTGDMQGAQYNEARIHDRIIPDVVHNVENNRARSAQHDTERAHRRRILHDRRHARGGADNEPTAGAADNHVPDRDILHGDGTFRVLPLHECGQGDDRGADPAHAADPVFGADIQAGRRNGDNLLVRSMPLEHGGLRNLRESERPAHEASA